MEYDSQKDDTHKTLLRGRYKLVAGYKAQNASKNTLKLTKLTCVPRHLEGKVKRWKALKDIQINKTILCEQQDRLAHP